MKEALQNIRQSADALIAQAADAAAVDELCDALRCAIGECWN